MAKKLYRSRKERMLGGVCGGLAEYFSIDPTLVRLAAVALVLAWGTGVLAYIIFWFVVPQRPLELAVTETEGEEPPTIESEAADSDTGNAAMIFGIVLVVIGFVILMGNFISFAWLSFSRLWPLILIAVGIMIILKRSGEKNEG